MAVAGTVAKSRAEAGARIIIVVGAGTDGRVVTAVMRL